MKIYKNFLVETKQEKTAIATYGRMNPPTIGHVKLAKKILSEARRHKAEPYICLSPTQNAKKDPLDPERKLYYVEKTIGPHIHIDIKVSLFEALSDLYSKGFKKLVFVVGSDRLSKFSKWISQYNGVEGKAHGFYDFTDIDFVSSGDRDPDAEGAAGMSASKLREFAVSGNFDSFSKGTKLSAKDTKSMYNEIRKAMKIETIKTEQANLKEALRPGTKVKVAHPAKGKGMVTGKIVRYDNQGPGSPFYVVDIGELRSEKVPAHKIKEGAEYPATPTAKKAHLAKLMKKVKDTQAKREIKTGYKIIDRTPDWMFSKEEAPPGREHQVKSLKKKVGTKKAYAFAWAQHNKHGLPEETLEEGTRLQVKMALGDAGVEGKFKDGKVSVHKKHVKKAHKALKGNVYYKGKTPDVVGEDIIDEGKFSNKMIDALKSKYESLRGKRLSLGQNVELEKIVRQLAKDKDALSQLVKADIPFISMNARLILNKDHGVPLNKSEGVENPYANLKRAPSRAMIHKMWSKKAQQKKKNMLKTSHPGYNEEIIIDEMGHIVNISEVNAQFAIEENLKKKAEQSGISFKILEKVYNRGISAWETGHKPGTTSQQWADSRVNSFLTGGKTRLIADEDLWNQVGSKHRVKEEMDTDHAFKKWLALTEKEDEINELSPELMTRAWKGASRAGGQALRQHHADKYDTEAGKDVLKRRAQSSKFFKGAEKKAAMNAKRLKMTGKNEEADLEEGDVVVDTPQGRYVKKGSVASAKIKARRSFRDHKDKKAITSRIATPIERKYLQRKDEG